MFKKFGLSTLTPLTLFDKAKKFHILAKVTGFKINSRNLKIDKTCFKIDVNVRIK